MNSIIGIDPGKGGGVAIVYFGERYEKWVAHKCPKTIIEMAVLLKMFKHTSPNTKCFIESVHAFPTDGRSSAFKFGMNYGIWQGILSSLGIETEFVTPQKWQKHFGELPKIKKDRKNKLKEIASHKSELKATLSSAAAICIAIYGYENTN